MKDKYADAFLRISGAGTPGILATVLLEVPIFLFSLSYNFLRINISFKNAFFLGSVFFMGFLLMNLWALNFLPFEKRGKELIKEGPYKFIRHPSYFAKIFLLLPGLSIFFRVWLPVVFLPLVLLIWNLAVKEEEKELKKDFGDKYEDYCKKTGKFFPGGKFFR